MKHVPNCITLSRIILSITLLVIHTFSPMFFVVYTYCGVSDVLDGFLARKFSLSTENGAKLDSISDIVFYGITAAKIMPSLLCVLMPPIWWLIAVVLVIRIISYTVEAVKKVPI